MRNAVKQLSAWLLALAMVFTFMPALENAYADAEIPEGAPFTKVVTDVEGVDAVVTATEGKASYNGGEATIYKITVPVEVKKLSITLSRADVYFEPTYGTTLSGCTNKGGMCSFVNSDYDDDTVTFHVDPSAYTTDDGYWAAPYKKEAFQPLFGFTVERTCDHPEAELTYTEGQEATCTEAGSRETWYCAKCGKYFTDKALTTKIKAEDIPIAPLGHDFGEDGLCTRCGRRGDATIEFTGGKVDAITDESAPRTSENACIDFTFKVDNAFVAYDPTVKLDTIFTRAEHIVVYAGDITIKGVTVPNYKIYGVTTNVRLRGISGNSYIMAYDGNGNSMPNGYNARYNDLTVGEQYFAGKSSGNSAPRVIGETAEAYYGFIPCAGEPEIEYDELIPDENGVYMIPGEKLKIGSTVKVLVDKTAPEKVEDQINAIGEVTLEKEEAITAARAAYEALGDADKEKVDPAVLLKLTNAEQELALLKARTDENAELIDAQLAAIRQNQAAIDALNEQLKAMENASAADKAALESQIADLQAANEEIEGLIEELQTANDSLAESAATKAELETKLGELNQQILDLQTALNKVSGEVSGKDALDKSRNAASKELTQYLEDNLDGMYATDQSAAELAALKAIIKIKDAEAQAEIDQLVTDAKAEIDEKVDFKTETEAAIKEAKAYKVSGLKVKAKAKKFTVTWKKITGATSYQVQYRLKGKKWSNLKASVKSVKATSKKLKKGKKYQFKVRTITVINGKKVYGAWSAVKTAKCK